LETEHFKIYRPNWERLETKGLTKEKALSSLEEISREETVPYGGRKALAGLGTSFLPRPLRKMTQKVLGRSKIICDPKSRICSSLIAEDYLKGMHLPGVEPYFAMPFHLTKSKDLKFVGGHTVTGEGIPSPETLGQKVVSMGVRPATTIAAPVLLSYAGGKKMLGKVVRPAVVMGTPEYLSYEEGEVLSNNVKDDGSEPSFLIE